MTEPPRVYLDANVLIGIVAVGPGLSAGQLAFLAELENGRRVGVTSELSLIEVLVKPLAAGDQARVDAFLSLLSAQGLFHVLQVTRDILLSAARHRADTRMKLPDAVHVATAERAGCGDFVSSDRGVRLPVGIRHVIWNQLMEGVP